MRETRIPFVTPQLYELENGDLLIKDAPLLAEGEWTDSAVQTPLYYTAKALEKDAGNWVKRTGFNRHLKGVPRDESNRVSEAIAPHFGQFKDDEGNVHNAVLSDILVYGSTASGRAMQELIKRKQIKYLSVEHGGEEWFNPETGRMETKSLEFYGYAHVNKGACKVCRVNEAPAEPKEETPAPVAAAPVEETMTDTKELEDKIATLTRELEAVKAQKSAEVKIEIPKELSELPGQMKELAAIPAVLKAMSDRLDALEKSGTSKTTTGAPKELSEAEPMNYHVSIDRKAGTIRAV
ncbi:hypothetical protein [Methanoregula sp.]|uniref:hypothetical protein n=1 Tax=Methanoregula sp. TaxID=2052170 RepID=UPI003563D26B